jgi:hypothetical protein
VAGSASQHNTWVAPTPPVHTGGVRAVHRQGKVRGWCGTRRMDRRRKSCRASHNEVLQQYRTSSCPLTEVIISRYGTNWVGVHCTSAATSSTRYLPRSPTCTTSGGSPFAHCVAPSTHLIHACRRHTGALHTTMPIEASEEEEERERVPSHPSPALTRSCAPAWTPAWPTPPTQCAQWTAPHA